MAQPQSTGPLGPRNDIASVTQEPVLSKTTPKERPARTSTLTSALTPPTVKRPSRASGVQTADGKLTVDVKSALESSSSRESHLTASAPADTDEQTIQTTSQAPSHHEALNLDEEKEEDVYLGELLKDNGSRGKLRRLSRRVSDAGTRRVNAMLGSIKRRLKLGRQREMDSSSSSSSDENVEARSDLFRGKRLSASAGVSASQLSLKEKSPASLYASGQRNAQSEQIIPQTLVSSPVDLQEERYRSMKMVVNSRPHPHHASSAPAFLTKSQLRKTRVSSPNVINLESVKVPPQWAKGNAMYKISSQGRKLRKVSLDSDQGFVLWESRKSGIIRIEDIKEIRANLDAKSIMNQFKLNEGEESRWISIIYLTDEKYKQLNLVALNSQDLDTFLDVLQRLRELRLAMLDPHPETSPTTETSDPLQQTKDNSDQGRSSSLPNQLPHSPSVRKHLTNEQRQRLWELHHWKGSDVSADGRVDFKELKRMAHKMSLGLQTKELEEQFQSVRVTKETSLNFDEFAHFWRRLRTRGDIQLLWRNLLDEGDTGDQFTFSVFERFMRLEQKDSRTTEDLQKIFLRFASPGSGPSSKSREDQMTTAALSLEAFTTYLMSSDNGPFVEQNLGIHHDMTRPLADYYISSSHNTYLVGHQLIGDSTTEGYIRALLQGCRCVEIDIYDGEKEPVITHGGTLTSKVPLRTICEAIAQKAFVASPYPVIISAEVHCGLAQQDAIAMIMRECFGEMLVDHRLEPDSEQGPLQELPSPQTLMRKILLKTKNPSLLVATAADGTNGDMVSTIPADTDHGSSSGLTSDGESRMSRRRGSASHRRSGSRSQNLVPMKKIAVPPKGTEEALETFDGSPPSSPPPIHKARPSKSSKPKIFSKALGELLVYTVGVRFRGINKKEHYAVEHMFSLSEKKADKILKEVAVSYVAAEDSDRPGPSSSATGGMLDLMKHAQHHLVRIYPKGMRLKSTNYLPHRYWVAGVQVVALNWQTADLGYMINRAMFLRNGGCGYVLKPVCLQSHAKKLKDLVSRRKKYELEVTIISAQQIPRPRDKEGRDIVDNSTMDPWVQVSVYVPDWPGRGTAAKDASKAEDNGLSTGLSSSPSKISSLRRSMESPRPDAPGFVLQHASTSAKIIRGQTDVVKNNGFNPVWQHPMRLQFVVAGDMLDLVFIRFCVRDEGDDEDERPLATYCVPLASLKQGYRHLPLHSQSMMPYPFATLFVRTNLRELES